MLNLNILNESMINSYGLVKGPITESSKVGTEFIPEDVEFDRYTEPRHLDNVNSNTAEVITLKSDVEKIQKILVNSGVLAGSSVCRIEDSGTDGEVQLSYLLEFSKDSLKTFINNLSKHGIKITEVDNGNKGRRYYKKGDDKIYLISRLKFTIDWNSIDANVPNKLVGYIPKKDRVNNTNSTSASMKVKVNNVNSSPKATVSSIPLQKITPTGNPIYTINGKTIDARNYAPRTQGEWSDSVMREQMRAFIRTGKKPIMKNQKSPKVYSRYYASKEIKFDEFTNNINQCYGIDKDIIAAIDQYFS